MPLLGKSDSPPFKDSKGHQSPRKIAFFFVTKAGSSAADQCLASIFSETIHFVGVIGVAKVWI